jgi:hypothetical protein
MREWLVFAGKGAIRQLFGLKRGQKTGFTVTNQLLCKNYNLLI